jgi:protein kinase A
VRSKHNLRFYAIKVLNKAKVHKTKQVEHTNNEQRLLEAVQHPFIINLWGTFQDSSNLYMVMDFVPGGELFTLLRRSNVSKIASWISVRALILFPALSRPRRQILCR